MRLSVGADGPHVEVLGEPDLHKEFLASITKAVNAGDMSVPSFIVAVRKAFHAKNDHGFT